MSESVVLHQWEISPFCQKVVRMLKLKEIAFDVVNYNGILGAKASKLSMVGKLPVLDIHGKRIQDSTQIARYLDEAFPNAPLLYPKDPLEKAYVELWEDWADELLYFYEIHYRINDTQAFRLAVAKGVEGRPTHETLFIKPLLKATLSLQLKMQGLGRMSNRSIDTEFIRHLERIDLVLQQTGWLVGSNKTIADIAVGSQLLEIVRTHQKFRTIIQSYPSISTWLEQL